MRKQLFDLFLEIADYTVVLFQVQNDVPKSDQPKPASPKQEKVASPKQEKTKSKSPPPPVKEPIKSKSPELSAPKEKKTLAPIRASAGSQAASDWMKSAREEIVKSETPSSSGAQVCFILFLWWFLNMKCEILNCF